MLSPNVSCGPLTYLLLGHDGLGWHGIGFRGLGRDRLGNGHRLDLHTSLGKPILPLLLLLLLLQKNGFASAFASAGTVFSNMAIDTNKKITMIACFIFL